MMCEGAELARNAENHSALSPVSILIRVARVHPELPAQIHGRLRRNWGEVPCAFVELSGAATEDELLAHAKPRLAGYQRPKKVIFGELPKTTTGKIRKNDLRDLVRAKS